MPGNKVTKKQLPPLRLKPLRPENKYLLKQSRRDVRDLKMASSSSKQDEAIALYMAELKQAERDEAKKVFQLKKATETLGVRNILGDDKNPGVFGDTEDIKKMKSYEEDPLEMRRNEAELDVIAREIELRNIKEGVAKGTAIRKAELDEAKMLLSAEKRIGAKEIKLAKEKLKEAKATEKRTYPSFTDRVRYRLTGVSKIRGIEYK